MSPEKRADRVAAKKAWRDANPLKVMLQKRRGRKTGTWGYATREKYLEAMARQNRRPGRAEKRRLAAKAQNVYFAARPSCRECGGEVVWSGLGRPRLRCDSCRSQKVAA